MIFASRFLPGLAFESISLSQRNHCPVHRGLCYMSKLNTLGIGFWDDMVRWLCLLSAKPYHCCRICVFLPTALISILAIEMSSILNRSNAFALHCTFDFVKQVEHSCE